MKDGLDDALAAFRAEQDRARGDAQTTRRRLLRSAQRQETRRKLSIAASLLVVLLATNSVTWAWSTGRLDEVLGGSSPGTETTPSAASASHPTSAGDPPLGAPPPTLARSASDPHPAPTPVQRPVEAAPSPVPAPGERASARRPAPTASAPDPHQPAEHRVRRTEARPAVQRPDDGALADPVLADPVLANPVLADPVSTQNPASPDRALAEDPSLTDQALAEDLRALEPAAPSRAELDRRTFERAHRVHFDGGAPLRALAAWEGYLARFPDGHFIPEARFNRAVTLLRLHRDADARAALQPFADGAHGGVRRREARALLDALDQGHLRR